MAADNMTPEAVASLEAYRRRKDAKHADKIDTRFFNMNPARLFHVRPSLLTEQVPATVGRPANNACLMMVDRHNKRVERWYMPLNLNAVPDEENFLAHLWMKWEQSVAQGKDLDISPDEHKHMLVETGNWKDIADV